MALLKKTRSAQDQHQASSGLAQPRRRRFFTAATIKINHPMAEQVVLAELTRHTFHNFDGTREPRVGAISNQTIAEGSQLSFQISDEPGLTYTLVNGPPGAQIDATGLFAWTPQEEDGPGSYQVVVDISDGENTDRQEFTITVTEVNSPPRFPSVDPPVIDEGVTLGLNLAATDDDLPANTLTYQILQGPPGAEISRAGWFSWTATELDGGNAYPVSVQVSDGTDTDHVDFNITVNEVNTAPIPPEVHDLSLAQGTSLSLSLAGTDTDVPPQPLTYTLDAPSGATINSTSGLFFWATAGVMPGTYPITVHISDGQATSSATFQVTVTHVNTGPIFPDIPDQTIPEGSTLTLSVRAVDPDPGDVLTYAIESGPGAATIDYNGTFRWTTTEVDGGQPPFHIVVSASDGTVTERAAFNVTVLEVNTPPVFRSPGMQSIPEGSTIQVPLANYVDDPDFPNNTFTFYLDDGPPGSGVDPATGVFTWATTEADGPGVYDITVSVSDGTDRISTLFSIRVDEVNVAPHFEAINLQSITVGSTLTFNLRDHVIDEDDPPQTLLFTKISGPGAVDPAGPFTWTPTVADVGQVQVAVGVSDGQAVDQTTFLVNVELPRYRVHIDGLANEVSEAHVHWEVFLLDFSVTPAVLINKSGGANTTDLNGADFDTYWTFLRDDVPENEDLVLRVWTESTPGVVEVEATRTFRVRYP